MNRNDIKGRSGRNKFPVTDKKILQGQAVKEGDVEKKTTLKGMEERNKGVAEFIEEQRNCVQSESAFRLNGNFCRPLC